MCKTKYQKLLTSNEVIKCQEIVLKEKFPLKTYASVLSIQIYLGLCMIGFQIGLIVVKGPYYYVGVG